MRQITKRKNRKCGEKGVCRRKQGRKRKKDKKTTTMKVKMKMR